MARDSLLRACATLGLLLAFSGCSALVDPDEGQLGGPNSDSGIVLMDAGGGGGGRHNRGGGALEHQRKKHFRKDAAAKKMSKGAGPPQ